MKVIYIQNNRSRIHRFLLYFLLTAVLLTGMLPGPDIIAQAPQDQAARAKADSLASLPFPVVGIIQEFRASNLLITDAGKMLLSPEAMAGIETEIDTLFSMMDLFLGDSTTTAIEDLGSREMEQVEQRLAYFRGQTDGLLDRLTVMADDLENEAMVLGHNRQRWQLTLDQSRPGEVPASRTERIRGTIQRLDSISNLVQDDMMFIMDRQDLLAAKKSELRELTARAEARKKVLGETLWKVDQPGFFKELPNVADGSLYRSHLDEIVSSFRTDWLLLRSGYMRKVGFALVFLMVLLVFTPKFKKNHSQWISEKLFRPSDLHLTFINYPVVSSLFFVTIMMRFLVPDLPRSFYAINLLVLMVAMAILMIRIYGGVFRTWIIVLVSATSVIMLYELAYHPGIVLRVLLVLMCIVGFWLYYWIWKSKPYENLLKDRLVLRSFRILIVVFMALQFLSIIANLAGAFHLAEFFALIPFQLAILAIAIQIFSNLTDTILYLALASNYVQKLNVAREEFKIIYHKLTWLVNFFLIVAFFLIAFGILRIRELVMEWGRGVLSDGISIGAIDITLGSIAIFVFVIWLSIMISRIVSHVLEKDVFTRVKSAKGVPGTIILMLKIILISGGFFLAAAASGMHLTNLSIVLGAFSVGIGFGLQNIFNNMVSGIILAIERPLNVGDVVQVGELIGTVGSIGLRSSKVKSFDGAEVIVPNGNLISNEMINWTLSDSYRRMDLRVGVKYGTDPEQVIRIMEQIANEHEGVMKEPPPRAFFIEFGDSSLNFRLLAWAHLDIRLQTESEILVKINTRLAEAGIEIPFPQRDLHIRSDATKGTPPSEHIGN